MVQAGRQEAKFIFKTYLTQLHRKVLKGVTVDKMICQIDITNKSSRGNVRKILTDPKIGNLNSNSSQVDSRRFCLV